MRWRLILDDPAGASWNMAVDQAVQAARVRDDVPPTLRLYGFSPRAVTLGRFQAEEDVDLAACGEMGIEVVRRPTGGRAVVHDDEVTYSVVAAAADGVPRGVAASYEHLSRALTAAYGALGVDARMSRGRTRGGGTACYLQATRADLSFGGAKLSGSAQVWHRDVCLQHGSVVLSRDVEAEARALGIEDAGTLRNRCTSLGRALGSRPTVDQVTGALVEAFRTTLGIEFEASRLTEPERAAAEGLQVAPCVQPG
jgi:lipoate-protein ligase A